jgi:pyruvate dehydrogenase E2 component (dihydrolipoamide acetyltransferase)
MADFKMPSLGADMQAATLVEWKVAPGDRVSRGDIIAEIETEKGDIDVEVFENGRIEELVAEPGDRLPVGAVMARIRSAPEEAGAAASPEADGGSPGPERTGRAQAEDLKGNGEKQSDGTSPAGRGESRDERAPRDRPRPEEPHREHARRRVRASPLARRVAEDLGVDLRRVTGSGPEGAIQRADVEAAARAVGAAPATHRPADRDVDDASRAERGFDPGTARQAIARAMSRSNREIPHYYLETQIDMQAALNWLQAQNEKRSVEERLLPLVPLLMAVARALDEVPALNGYWRNDRHEPQEPIHLGVAISLRQGGLVTPAIHDADRKSPDELMAALNDLISRARRGKLRSSELTDPTITVTSLGDLGVGTVHGVIYPPQVALVGFGSVRERPWAENGLLGVRPVLTATLAADHRATDGRDGARFLAAIDAALQGPDPFESRP